ncbi:MULTISPECIES: tail fiber domain-containing protein [unclassified Burkholderia]|uniref:tail fiber domain-containing protein n=1 Tax=unclassified Burkholderia TaxID=2613784 RepID=UPI001E54679F|nr:MULTISPECIES: tail fiber domain-containing protein [unclassified Burkholderia]UEP28675.1 tail fiber domain-containing protein [Burkholderia sp. B21-007]UEP42133.1 tail fiber domain-containing protein [Burkholderia sp. B21-005]
MTINVVAVLNISALRSTDHTQFTSVCVQGYYLALDGGGGLYHCDTTDTTSSDNGGTVIVASDGARWKLQTIGGFVAVEQFGAKGDGAADDTDAINRCLASFGLSGGTAVAVRIYNVSTINVPQNCSLAGELQNSEQTLSGSAQNYYSWGSQVRLQASGVINLARGASLDKMLIIRAGLSLPVTNDTQATAVVGQMSGVGVSVTDAGCSITNTMLLGHGQAINVLANQSNTQGRFYMSNVRIDSKYGVYINGAYDLCRLYSVHCWPFLTVHASGVSGANLSRAGVAFSLENVDDWSQLVSCFAYGYGVAYQCSSTANIEFLACQADGPSAGQQTAFNIIGTSTYTHMEGCMVNSYQTAVAINIGPIGAGGANWPEVRSVNGNYNCIGTCISVDSGQLRSVNDSFHSGTVGVAFGAGTLHGSSLSTPYFNNGVGTPWNFASDGIQKIVSVVAPTFYGGAASANPSQVLSDFNIVSQSSVAPGVGPSYQWSGPYSTYTGLYASVQARLVSGTTGNEASDLVFSGFRAGAMIDRLVIDHDGHLYPAKNNAYNCGGPNNRWLSVYAANGMINTSDETYKTDVREIDEVLLDAFALIRPVQFRWKMGDDIRWRVGYRAQDLERALRQRGADPAQYSLWVRDEIVEDGQGTGRFIQGLDYDQLAVLREALERRRTAEVRS